MQKILKNKIRCNKCGEEIESTNRHDFKSANAEQSPWMVAWIIYADVAKQKITQN